MIRHRRMGSLAVLALITALVAAACAAPTSPASPSAPFVSRQLVTSPDSLPRALDDPTACLSGYTVSNGIVTCNDPK